MAHKERLLRKAARAFFEHAGRSERREFEAFFEAKRAWLESYARYAALKAASAGLAWFCRPSA